MFPVKLNPERINRKNIRKSGNTGKREKGKKPTVSREYQWVFHYF